MPSPPSRTPAGTSGTRRRSMERSQRTLASKRAFILKGSRPAASTAARSFLTGTRPAGPGSGRRISSLLIPTFLGSGFWGTPANQRAKDVGLFVKMGVSCAAFIGWKHRAQARVSSVNTCRFNTRRNAPSSGTGRESPRECPKETIGHTACSERSALLQSARENNTSRDSFLGKMCTVRPW